MVSIVKTVRLMLAGLGAVGSTFIKKTVDGKYEIAIAPITLAVAIGSGVTCAVQKSEPFRVCVKNTMAMFREVVNAN